MKRQDIDLILNEDRSKYRVFILIIISISILLFNILLFIIDPTANNEPFKFDFLELKLEKNQVVFIKIIFQAIIAALLSILAAYFYNHLQEMDYKKKLLEFKKLAPDGLLNSLISNLRKYDYMHCKDYHITLLIDKYNHTSDFLKCTVIYKYEKLLNNSRLKFHLERTDDTKKRDKNVDHYLSHEYFYLLNEATLAENKKNLTDLYKISNIIINGEEYESPSLNFEINLAKNYNHKDYNKISYDVTFPIEKGSCLFFTIELPTLNFDFNCHYTAIADTTDLIIENLSTCNSHPLDIKHYNDALRTFNNDSWVLPKSTIAVVWWEKNDNSFTYII